MVDGANKSIFNRIKTFLFGRLIGRVAIILIAVTLLVFTARNWMNNQRVSKVVVEGNILVPDNEIINLVKDSVVGQKIKHVDLAQVTQKVKNHILIRDAIVSYKTGKQLQIEIVERAPIALTRQNNSGDIAYVDADGIVIQFEPRREFVGLPVITGINMRKAGNESIIAECMEIIRQIVKINSVDQLISEIVYKNGQFYFNSSFKNVRIMFGRADNINDKLIRLGLFYEKAMIEGIEAEINWIDLRWRSQIVIS